MPNSVREWFRALVRLALIVVFAAIPAAALAEWKLVEEWPRVELNFEPGTEGVEYNNELNRYVGLEEITTQEGELIQVTVGSYFFQPALAVLDVDMKVQARSRHQEAVPKADGYVWYETVLQFECCPGANSGDPDIPTKYYLRYSSQGISEVGLVFVSGARLVWVEPGPVDPGPVDPGPFECNCQDPASGKWYEGSMGGMMCPPVTPETRFCTSP